MIFFARQPDSFCVQTTSPATLPRDTGTPGSGDQVTISAPVGNRGANREDDTRAIQRALNRVPADQGRPVPALADDGKCGPKTIKGIQTFQLRHFGWGGADGLVEPGKQTIAMLNVQTGAVSFPDMAPVVRLTEAWVLACLRHLEFVDTVLDRDEPAPGSPFQIVVFDRAQVMRLVNKHFDLDLFPNRRSIFNLIRGTFATMRTVFERPGGLWGVAMFDRDPLNRALQAYTVGAGFFHSGQFVFAEGKKLRADSIYLCVRFANELQDDNRRAFVVIHELAHFVGHPQPIGDFAHNKQGNRIRTIPPNLKVINAETYANFAWEVVNGTEAPIF